MNYYERHIGDYLKDTAHLSLLEHGVYTRLLDVYYTREGGIPAADAARLIGARSRDEKAALQAVLGEFFSLVDGHHTQARSDREIERFKGKQEKARRSAEARWGAPKQQPGSNANASSNDDAQGMRSHSEGNATGAEAGARSTHQSPDTSNQTPEETHTDSATDVARDSAATPSSPTMAGAVCITLRAKGIASVNPSHPELLALLQAGVDIGAFGAAAEKAVANGRPTQAYVLGIVKGQMQQAQNLAQQAANAPPPAQSRVDRQLQTAAGLTGSARRQPTKEIVDVDARVIPS